LSGQVNDSVSRLEKQLSQKPTDTARFNYLVHLAEYYSSKKSTLNLAQKYIDEAFSLARKKKLKIPYTFYWVNAEVFFQKTLYFESMKEIEKAIELLKGTDKPKEMALASNMRANSFLFLGKFAEAIDAYLANVQFITAKNLITLLPSTYRELAVAYNIAGKRDLEKIWTEKMLQASLVVNDKENLARAYFRLGDLSSVVDSNWALSNEYYKESLRIREQKGDSALYPVILNRICWGYYKLHQLDTALKYYTRMADISQRQRNYPLLANALANMGTIYRDKKDNNKALLYYGKSTAFSILAKDWSTLAWMNNDMSELFVQSGDFKKAYYCYVAYKNYSDSLKAERSSLSLADARLRYATDAKAKDLEVLTLRLKNQRYFMFALAGGLLFILITGLFLFRQSKMNAKRRISEMNRKISEITQANLRQQMNPHFIFNTLNSIQYYMYQHDKIATNNYLTKFSSLMRKTLENSQHTTVTVKDEIDALELYLELEIIRFKNKFSYSIEIDEEIDPLLYKLPTMLIQPYVENAIVHGLVHKQENGTLKVILRLMKDHMACIVEDNGIGRKAAMEIKKGKESNHNSLGTRIAESRLQLVNDLYGTNMKIQYTDLTDITGKPSGTRAEIQIPIIT